MTNSVVFRVACYLTVSNGVLQSLLILLPTAKPWSPGLMKRSSALPKLPGTGQLDSWAEVFWCLPALMFEILLTSCQVF